jgi:hypothetical protein
MLYPHCNRLKTSRNAGCNVTNGVTGGRVSDRRVTSAVATIHSWVFCRASGEHRCNRA